MLLPVGWSPALQGELFAFVFDNATMPTERKELRGLFTCARAEVVGVIVSTGISVVVLVANVDLRLALTNDVAVVMASHQLEAWVVLHLLSTRVRYVSCSGKLARVSQVGCREHIQPCSAQSKASGDCFAVLPYWWCMIGSCMGA